ncbi:MAG TPA: hypothetical protein VJB56_02870 [Candidatus Paceibacterota bacterium]
MVFDVLRILPIFAAVFIDRQKPLFFSTLLALLGIGAFSAFPAGVEEIALLTAIAAGLFLKKVLNTRSFISRGVVAFSALAIHACIMTFSWGALYTIASIDVLKRGGFFMARELVITFSLLIFFLFLRYSFGLMRHAFLEENIV